MGMGMGMPMGMMVPRCRMTMVKADAGFAMECASGDQAAAMQCMCSMMSGGMMSCCMVMNGMPVMMMNMTMAQCRCEPCEGGMRLSCTSGDKAVVAMLHACCDMVKRMMDCGASACLMMGGMPICHCCQAG